VGSVGRDIVMSKASTRMKAQNECTKCAYRWHDHPGGQAEILECPCCESIYWIWTNYKEEINNE